MSSSKNNIVIVRGHPDADEPSSVALILMLTPKMSEIARETLIIEIYLGRF